MYTSIITEKVFKWREQLHIEKSLIPLIIFGSLQPPKPPEFYQKFLFSMRSSTVYNIYAIIITIEHTRIYTYKQTQSQHMLEQSVYVHRASIKVNEHQRLLLSTRVITIILWCFMYMCS